MPQWLVLAILSFLGWAMVAIIIGIFAGRFIYIGMHRRRNRNRN